MIDAIMQRLLANAAGLRSVQGALDLTRLLQSKGLPGEGPAAFVVPVGLRGGAVQDATGLFVQNTDETIGVVVVFRNVEAGARGAADPVKPVIDAVIAALAGWGPEGAQDVFRLASLAEGVDRRVLDDPEFIRRFSRAGGREVLHGLVGGQVGHAAQ